MPFSGNLHFCLLKNISKIIIQTQERSRLASPLKYRTIIVFYFLR